MHLHPQADMVRVLRTNLRRRATALARLVAGRRRRRVARGHAERRRAGASCWTVMRATSRSARGQGARASRSPAFREPHRAASAGNRPSPRADERAGTNRPGWIRTRPAQPGPDAWDRATRALPPRPDHLRDGGTRGQCRLRRGPEGEWQIPPRDARRWQPTELWGHSPAHADAGMTGA